MYAASSSANMSVPVQKTVLSNGTATSTDTKIYYDSLAFDAVNKGNATKQEDWITGIMFASSTKTYDSYGLVTGATDRLGNATTYAYDSSNLYPATSTNALSQSSSYTYNYSNGKVKQSTDPNARLSRNTYDGVGRLTLVEQSDVANPASYVNKVAFQYVDSASPPSSVYQTQYLNSATTTDTYSFYDGLSRIIQERKSTKNSASSTVTDLTYNTAGLLASRSLPYFSAGTSSTAVSTNAKLFTAYAYDAFGRIATTVNAVGTTTTAYSKWTTTITDALGRVKDYTSDAYNNLAQVREYVGGSTATTTYTYDAANNLTKVTDAAANVRNFTYDGLGRRLTAEDLHAVGDGAFGTWSYTYDDAGNLASQTDPKSQVVHKTYDALNRFLTEDYTGQAGIEVTNT